MKKILFFVESLTVGGAEKSLLSLLNNMDLSQYQVTLMMNQKGGAFEQFVPKNIPIKYIDIKIGIWSRVEFKFYKLIDSSNTYHNAQLLWKSAQSEVPFLNENFDVAIAWGQGFATYFVANRVTAVKKYAWVNIDFEKAGYHPGTDIPIYTKFDKIVGVSEFVKQAMQKFINPNKVIAIINIIDREDIEVRADVPFVNCYDSKKTNILCVGRLTKQKGFELAIDAMKLLIKKNKAIHLYILGEGQERNFLENRIASNDLINHITLLGSKDNPYPYIKNCDLYLQTSRFEGLGRTIIEASILNKPIVCTDFPTAYSILEHDKTGLIVPMNPQDIATALLRLIENKEVSEKLILNLKNQQTNSKQKTLDDVKALLESK